LIQESHYAEFPVVNISPSDLLERLGKWAVEEQKTHFREGEGTVPGQVTNRTGTLMRSIHHAVQEFAVDILPDNSLPYAYIQQFGGQTHPTVTERSKGYFWFMFSLTGDEKWKWMALQKVGDVMTVTLRPIKYMYFTDKDIQYIQSEAHDWVVKTFTSKKEVV